MAPLPPVANVIKVSMGWECDLNTTAESIIHFQYSGGPPTSSDCAALAATFQAAGVTELKPLMNSINKVNLWTVLDLASNTGKQGTGGSVTAGTRTGNGLPASTCMVINSQIARRYRGGHPRTYLPLGSDADLNSTGTWGPSFVNSCAAAWASFITSCLAASSGSTTITAAVNVSYFNNKSLRVTPVVDPITLATARTRIGTQRRRNKKA